MVALSASTVAQFESIYLVPVSKHFSVLFSRYLSQLTSTTVLWLAKQDKHLVYSKQSRMGCACIEKTDSYQGWNYYTKWYISHQVSIQPTRSYPLHYSPPLINTYPYKFSFFPRTIVDWNILPHHLIELQSIDLFVVDVLFSFGGLVPLDASVIYWLSSLIK